MSPALAVDFIHHAITLCLMVAAPLLVTALVVGILVSMVQAVTQIQEQTLTFIPKFIAVGGVLILTLPWILRELVEYLTQTMRLLPVLTS